VKDQFPLVSRNILRILLRYLYYYTLETIVKTQPKVSPKFRIFCIILRLEQKLFGFEDTLQDNEFALQQIPLIHNLSLGCQHKLIVTQYFSLVNGHITVLLRLLGVSANLHVD
jgi:hypothetical protein